VGKVTIRKTKICYFGTYEKEYPRNRIIIEGLRKNDIEVIECNVGSLLGRHRGFFPFNYINLIKKFFEVKIRSGFDAIIVGYSMVGSFIDIFLARLLTRKTIIFNPSISLYETLVSDRRIVRNFFLKKVLYYVEKCAYFLADIVLMDTNQHVNYISKQFGIRKRKIKKVFVGAEQSIFYPRKTVKDDNNFLVLFYGKFIPLHGIEYIIKAAKILENEKNLKFLIIGRGQTSKEIMHLASKLRIKNVSFIDWVKYEDLPVFINKADVCLGIFSKGEKAMRVIPNKAFQVLATKKPLITGSSPAAIEIFTHKKNVVLCDMANPKALSTSILLLKENEKLRQDISRSGYMLFKEAFTPEKVGEAVKYFLNQEMTR